MRIVARILIFCAALLSSAGFACAQEVSGYPSRPVKIIVPFEPAGPTDVMARLIAQNLSENRSEERRVGKECRL